MKIEIATWKEVKNLVTKYHDKKSRPFHKFCFKATINNKVVGALVLNYATLNHSCRTFEFEQFKTFRITRLVVSPYHRKNGIARKLIDFAFRVRDIAFMEVITEKIHYDIIYEKCGFKTQVYENSRGVRLYGFRKAKFLKLKRLIREVLK